MWDVWFKVHIPSILLRAAMGYMGKKTLKRNNMTSASGAAVSIHKCDS